jgi:CheY-like chemotaxis protein
MSDAPKGRINLEKAVVLLVSEKPGMELLNRMMHGFGVRDPQRVFSPEQAMQACREIDFDLIVCDGAMASGGAYDFVAELRRSDLTPNRFAPTIILQGHTPVDQIEKARDCGANFVVAKPITPRTLLERILWIAQEQRPFIELDGYIGPDRRFQNIGPPRGLSGRRRQDRADSAPRSAIDPESSTL